MDKETKAKYSIFCEDCLTDPYIECPRNKDVKCLICNKELCAYHMMKHEHDKFECICCKESYRKSKMPHHLKESHQISITWTGFKFEKKGGEIVILKFVADISQEMLKVGSKAVKTVHDIIK